MLFIRKLHKWLGLIVGLQLLLWTISGLMFAWLDHHQVSAQHTTAVPDPQVLSASVQLTEPTSWLGEYQGKTLYEVRLAAVVDTPVWRVDLGNRIDLRNAHDGQVLTIDEGMARRLALSHYVGTGQLAAVEFHSAPGLETRKAGATWKAQFNDADETALYFSADDGRLVAARNLTWRWFDFFWMLHTMDYRGRDDFNNPLVITVGTAAMWLSLSGLLLLFRSFRRRDFDVSRLWQRER